MIKKILGLFRKEVDFVSWRELEAKDNFRSALIFQQEVRNHNVRCSNE